MGKGGEEPVAGCEAFFSRRGGGGGDLDVPAGGFEVGTLKKGGRVRFWFLVFGSLFIWCCGGRGLFLTYSDEVE